MSRARTRGLSAGEAVLGLVIEQPDHGFKLERRLEERFGSARFAYSTAYSALRRLERDGLVRAAAKRPASAATRRTASPASGAAGERASAEEVVYEATDEGRERFREWVRAPSSAPVLREELHARIALCEPRDLPRLIDVVHFEERACADELERIRKRMAREQPATGAPLADSPWPMLTARAVARGEAAFWRGRVNQLGQLRRDLEDLRGEAERRALEEHRATHRGKRRMAGR